MDLSEDTVSADTLLYGYTAHDKTGAQVTGTAVGLPPGGVGGQVLAKIDDVDYNVQWVDLEGPESISNSELEQMLK